MKWNETKTILWFCPSGSLAGLCLKMRLLAPSRGKVCGISAEYFNCCAVLEEHVCMELVVLTGFIWCHRHRNWGHWGHVPPRFCNKQRSFLFLFRKCPLFLKERYPRSVVPPSFKCFLCPCLVSEAERYCYRN